MQLASSGRGVGRGLLLAVLFCLVGSVGAWAQFSMTEVSGLGARPFYLTKAEWSYEDIPAVSYNFYRQRPAEPGYSCIHSGQAGPSWTGDPAGPMGSELFLYLVTAHDGTVENLPGAASDGTPRSITLRCPAPPAIGACCSATSCSDVTAATCTSVGGRFAGDGTRCADTPDPCASAATGACCVVAGPCTEETFEHCIGISGSYKGTGSSCSDTPDPCACGPGPTPPAVTWRAFSSAASPVDLQAPPGGDPTRLYVVEQSGYIRIIDSGTLSTGPAFLDIDSRVRCCGERGLLGLAFHPDFLANGRFFVNYTSEPAGATTISEFSATPGSDVVDPATERVLLTIAQPAANHNGGGVRFGPEGFLYIGTGDGGASCDTAGSGDHAQDLDDLLGKMLRIDIESAAAPLEYAIPPDNPFATGGGRREIWAYGLRNPWRYSFDRATGDLWIGDVGQGAREEVDFQAAASLGGENYGWVCMEGTLINSCGRPATVCPAAPPASWVRPVAEYPHMGAGSGCSITGGYVYRGSAIPALRGHYFYADYCSNFVRSFRYVCGASEDATVWSSLPGFPTGARSISAFGEGADGELYLVTLGGAIFKLEPM